MAVVTRDIYICSSCGEVIWGYAFFPDKKALCGNCLDKEDKEVGLE